MKHKRALLFSLLLTVFGIFAFVPREDGGFEKLVASLQRWTETNPQEKVYLHMDKPYYALGDTIWFKAYVTIGSRNHLSAQSQALYVDLINEQDSLIQTLKLPVIAGMGMGDFTLGDELNEGNYRIRAYTQWMRNAGEDYFFDKTFTVGSPGGDEVVARVDYQYELVNAKPMVVATLNYKDDNGKPLAEEKVRYEIILNDKVIYTRELETDISGNMSVNIANDGTLQAGSGFLRTTIYTKDNRKVLKTFPIKVALSKSDVQFFPEGGTLVNGITSRIGFKAIGIEGAGLAIRGVVIDNLDHEVIGFESLHAGMGSFMLKPEAGKNYKAKITYQDNSEAFVNLPMAQPEGYTLSVYQLDNDSVLVRVNASLGMIKNPHALGLIAQSGGETIYASKVSVNGQMNSLSLPKKSFPTGIAQFTLFDYKNEPISERVVFVKNNDQMEVRIKTAKKRYKSRERVEVELESSDPTGKPVAGSFSVSVVDESKVPMEESRESTILSNLLLTSDLKGYIEKPNYYFMADNDTINRALDNLMLTQGYRRFSWNEISKDQSSAQLINPIFKAESLGMDISGKVLTLGGQPLPNGKVTLMSLKSGILRDTVTDASGRFSFADMVLTDSIRFAVQARTEKKGKKVEIVLDTLPSMKLNKNPNLAEASVDIPETLNTYLANSKQQDKVLERMGALNRVQRLKEVVIRAKKLSESQYSPQGMYRVPDGHSDQTYTLLDANTCPSLGICLQGRLGGVVFRSKGAYVQNYPHFRGVPMRVFVDGRVMETDIEVADVFDNNVIDPTDIAKIEVVRTNLALMSMLGGSSIMIITKNGYLRKKYDPSIVNIRPKGYNKVREFYSPKYDYSNTSSRLPDLRATIYWNANIKTHGLGKTTFSYYNADGPGTYKVTVEGINAAGELARTVYRYEVEQGANTVQAPVDQTSIIAASLDSLQKRLPAEKVYLHTDKHYYNTGDTLWFKSYLMNASNLTAASASGLMYVELIDDSVEVVRRISVPVSKGLGWAQIPLPSKIFHEGAYTLRAYTNWMQNFGDDYFFTKRIYIGKPSINTWLVQSQANIKTVGDKDQVEVDLQFSGITQAITGLRDVEVKLFVDDKFLNKQTLKTSQEGQLKFSSILNGKADGSNIRAEVRTLHKADGNQVLQVPLRISRAEKIDLQFMPEGGRMVAGLKSRIGFKAVGEDGRSIEVSGAIYDSDGLQVAEFATVHNGMGSFDLLPNTRGNYTARINLPEATDKVYKLPAVNANGIVLRVNNIANDSLKVNILFTAGAFDMDSTYYLTATSRGVMTYLQSADVKTTNFSIAKSRFPTGITRLTLLKGKRPLAERIIFINHQDQLAISVRPDKPSYTNRDSVQLLLEVKDKSGVPVKGTFSLSVTDDSQTISDTIGNYGIAASLLLNADLRGNVEEPGYYFSNESGVNQALDILMLTQGWTGCDWSDVFAPPTAPKYSFEKEFKIVGKVSNILKKPVDGAQILISSQKPSFLTTTITDSTGKFVFKDLPQIDSGSFFIQARTPKGKSMNFGAIEATQFTPAETPVAEKDQLMPWYVNSKKEQLNYVKNFALKTNEQPLRQEGIALNEVSIVSTKIIPGSFNRNGPGKADLTFDEKDIRESGAAGLYQLLKQKLPGLRVVYDEQVPALLYNEYLCIIEIDGVPLPDRALELDWMPGRRLTPDQLKDAMNKVRISNMIGVEIMYSRRYVTGRYFARSSSGPDKFIPPIKEIESFFQIRANGPNRNMRKHAIISITTLNKRGWHVNTRPDYVSLRPLPIMKAKEFYSPRYTVKNNDVQMPDLRSTIFWVPDITTDVSGRARVSFSTADLPGTYSVTVEGSNMSGSIGSGSAKLKVNANTQSK